LNTLWLAIGIPNALVWIPYTARAPRLTLARRRLFAGSATIHVAIVACALALVSIATAAVASVASSDHSWIATMCLALAPFTLMMIAREHARRLCLADLQVRDLLRIDVPNAVLQFLLLIGVGSLGLLTAETAILAVSLACANTLTWFYANRDRFEFH